ncbi:MAG: protein kinase [Chloroflexota bacterium]
MDDLVGKTLGRYEIKELIGQGGMATVFKAYQISLDRYVAIKVLPAQYVQQEGFLQRFTREARAVAKLKHPNILDVYDFGEEVGVTYIVMEYVEGGTLKDRLTGPLPIDQALRLTSQLASALGYAHGQGIIHRDVKPSNVLLTKDGWPLLSDFGIAKVSEATSALTRTGVGMGTPEYMSPEQAQGMAVDGRSDIYSLGVMLYQMVTGQVPFQAQTPIAVVLRHIKDLPPPPRSINPDIPEAVEQVILQALAKNPDNRYQRAEEMAAALEQIVQTTTIPVERPAISAETMTTVAAARLMPKPQQELGALFARAQDSVRAQQWNTAVGLLRQVLAQDPSYPGAQALLNRAEAGIHGPTPLPGALPVFMPEEAPKKGPSPLVILGGIGAALIVLTCLVLVVATLFFGGIGALIALAEPTPTATPLPTTTPTPKPTATPRPTVPPPTPTLAGALLLADDFSNKNSGWTEESSDTADRGYVGGKYRILVKKTNWVVWAYLKKSFSDFAAEVTVQKESGPDNSGMGLIFRRASDYEFYLFQVSPLGQYQVSKLLRQGSEGWETLQKWTSSDYVNKGAKANRLRVEARGSQLQVYANDHLLTTIKDASFSSGDIGLLAGTFAEPQVSALFDDFKVYSVR